MFKISSNEQICNTAAYFCSSDRAAGVLSEKKKNQLGTTLLYNTMIYQSLQFAQDYENPAFHFSRIGRVKLGRATTTPPFTSTSLVFLVVFVNSSLQSDGKQESENDRLLRSAAQ